MYLGDLNFSAQENLLSGTYFTIENIPPGVSITNEDFKVSSGVFPLWCSHCSGNLVTSKP